MHQHMGAPAECLVNVGDRVEEGMLIGKAKGVFSANIHSPVPGEVTAVTDVYLPTGFKSKTVKIELHGEFSRSGKINSKQDWIRLSKEEIHKKIIEMGIVGLGGAAFPAHIKLMEGKYQIYHLR